MELNFYDVRIGTRTRAGNLNVIHSFVCKSVEKQEYKIRDFYQSRYNGLSIDVFKVIEVVEVPQDAIQKDSPFETEIVKQRTKIRELENEIKKLHKSHNSVFTMEIESNDLNDENTVIYKEMIEQYKLYISLVDKLEKFIKKQIIEKYSPFTKYVYTDELMSGSRSNMKFRLELKNKLF